MELLDQARTLIKEFWGERYSFGIGAISILSTWAEELGSRPLVVGNVHHLRGPLNAHHIIPGCAPNTPVSDVDRIRRAILVSEPDCIIAVGGGSTIDGVKAACAWAVLGGELESYFGTGKVSEALTIQGKEMVPLIAVQTASGSGAHLTKYANVTFENQVQKKLIVDEALIPKRAVFDYSVTTSVPVSVSLDGALDAMSHLLEVFFGITPDRYGQVAQLVEVGLPLILSAAPKLRLEASKAEVREALGLASDLGAYAIMIGGTNGPHLTSFSLVDLASHGRACAILGPYYTAFFAPAITPQLRRVARIFAAYDYLSPNAVHLYGRELGMAVAEAMRDFLRNLGYPTSLEELPGYNQNFIEKALKAAADPALAMKLHNMPVPFAKEDIAVRMRPLLEAAASGNLDLVPS